MDSDSDSDSVLKWGQKSIFNKLVRVSDVGTPQTTLQEILLYFMGLYQGKTDFRLILRLLQLKKKRICLKLKEELMAGQKKKTKQRMS